MTSVFIYSSPQFQKSCIHGPIAWHVSTLHLIYLSMCPMLSVKDWTLKGEDNALLIFVFCPVFGIMLYTESASSDWFLNEWLCEIFNLVKGNKKCSFYIKNISRLVFKYPEMGLIHMRHRFHLRMSGSRVWWLVLWNHYLKGSSSGDTFREHEHKPASFWLTNYIFMRKGGKSN